MTKMMTKRELTMEQIMKVYGGADDDNKYGGVTERYDGYSLWSVHKHCGGIISSNGPFSNCVCSKCGETHYSVLQFSYSLEWGIPEDFAAVGITETTEGKFS